MDIKGKVSVYDVVYIAYNHKGDVAAVEATKVNHRNVNHSSEADCEEFDKACFDKIKELSFFGETEFLFISWYPVSCKKSGKLFTFTPDLENMRIMEWGEL